MFKRTGKHAARRLHVGPLFALDAIRVTLAAKHEAQTATAAQLEELAQSPP